MVCLGTARGYRSDAFSIATLSPGQQVEESLAGGHYLVIPEVDLDETALLQKTREDLTVAKSWY